MTTNSKIAIHFLTSKDVNTIARALVEQGWRDRTEILKRYLVEQSSGERTVLVAEADSTFAGYGTIKWLSDYPPFRKHSIPEISDLNVLTVLRRRGIASALLDRAEVLIFERSAVAGIGVGMFSDYGTAQMMYVKRGYVPDGQGLFYKGQTVKEGQQVTVDHDLVLFMTKTRVTW